MKLGETTDPIYAISFAVQDGYKTPSYPFDEAVKHLFAIDGSHIDTINFGAREHRTAEFALNWIAKADFFTLMAYLEANAGKKIRVEFENAGERVFGELLPGPVCYAYVVSAEPLGESGYDGSRRLYAYSLQLDYAGASASAVPNAADASNYDFLLEGDCIQPAPGCQVANKAALDALTGVAGGSWGLTTSDLKVYIYNLQKAGGPGWDFLYTLPPNNPAMGLKNGVFRLSAFADVSAASPGSGGEDFKSGWIPQRGIKFPRFLVNARRGPAVQHPEGFGFALDNSTEVWKFPIENNIPFYGSKWKLSLYDRVAGRQQLLATGYNNHNAFDSSLLHFTIEPGILFHNKSWPTGTVGPGNYPNASKKMQGKPVITTYGRWDAGELQPISFENNPILFPNGRRYLGYVSWDSVNRRLVLDQPTSQVQSILGYAVGSYPQGVGRLLYVMIHAMDGSPDVKKLKKVTALADSSGNIRLTLDSSFETPPDTTAIFLLYLANNQLVIDESPCVGMRKAGYLWKGALNDGPAPLQLFGKEGSSVRPIPDSAFKMVEDTQENKLVVDSDHLSLEADGTIILKDRVPLTQVEPINIHSIVDQRFVQGPGGPSDPIDTFAFGFQPDGVESNIVKVKPFERISRWADSTPSANTGGRTVKYPGTILQGDGRLLAAYSANRTTLAWTPLQGATGYRLSRYIVSPGSASGAPQGKSREAVSIPEVYTLDTTFGTSGFDTVSGEQNTLYVDTTVNNTLKLPYEYKVEPLLAGSFVPPISSNRGFNRSKPSGAPVLLILGKHQGATLLWALPDAQASFIVYRDDVPIASFTSTTQAHYLATGLTNNTEYKFKIAVNSLAIGTAGDRWIQQSGTVWDVPVWWLLPASAPNSFSAKQTGLFDGENSDIGFEGWKHSWGGRFNRRNADAADFSAAGVVFSWLWKVDHKAFPNMANAKDVRLLADFVVRSYVGNNTPIPIIIQCRLIKRDRTFGPAIQKANLTCKAPPESGSRGAYANFLNLPAEKKGSGSNANYDTEQQAPNADAIYTGKDLWKLPDHLFEDDANEWKQVEYIMFSITNADPIAYAHVKPGAPGYKLGIGGPWGKTWTLVKEHKPLLFIEYTREFEAGLEQPLFGRIDGGRKDDAGGTITGTPGRIIEKARHVIDHVVYSTLGYKPTYIGNEMKSRDGWIWRWQTKESKPLLETLDLLVKNIHGIFTFTPDDQLCLRTYDIDEPGVNPVFNFNESNILADSFGDPEFRKRDEIYQKFRLLYNLEPSQDGKPTEEMVIGWDMQTSKPIFGGYANVEESADGILYDAGSLDGLATLCRLSTYLYASGGKVNEYGFGPGNERIFDLFYRPTRPAPITGFPIERELPNLTELWGAGVMQPKRAMQALMKRVIKSLCFDSWYFPIAVSMRNVIYNPAVQGILNEAGDAENRIKLADLVTVTGKKTGGHTLRGLVLGMDLQSLYDGYATLNIFCPRPPGQFGPFVDPRWDAGGPGPRNTANMVFKGNLYGLVGEAGTFPNARGPGARNTTLMRFPDGSYADAKGSGSGKA
jgi:hypothetical protein